jgi:hypothetical protein
MNERILIPAIALVAFAVSIPVGLAIADVGGSEPDRPVVRGVDLDLRNGPIDADGRGSAPVPMGDCPDYVLKFWAGVDPKTVPGTMPTSDTLVQPCPTREDLEQQLAVAQAAQAR